MRNAALLAIAALSFAVLVGSSSARPPLPELAGMKGKRTIGQDTAGFLKQHGPHSALECTKTLSASDQIIDCDDPFPNNEPDIEAGPGTIVVSSNDYGSCCDEFNTSKDDGVSWVNGNMSIEKPLKTGSDPVTAWDAKHGVWLHASLSYDLKHASGTQACDGDVVVSPSTDGLVWPKPALVSDGVGCDLQKSQLFNDKEWIVVDNNPSSPRYGRAYVTWSGFLAAGGAYLESPIMFASSDDGGRTWGKPKEISGSNAALCTFQGAGPAGECDENQYSVPVVLPNGNVVVAFENDQNEALWETGDQFDDQYLVVRSTNGGATWSSPVQAAALEDGALDYPINVNGRQTLTGYQLRVNSAGNIAVSSSGKLAIVFSDNRAGTPATDTDPAETNTNVFAVWSSDGGATWSTPESVASGAGDEWFPWAEFAPGTTTLGVVFHSRASAGAALYDTKYATGAQGGPFASQVVSAAPSDPTDSVFFQAEAEGCEKCATFHGDYNGLSYGANGTAHMAWTDMSVDNTVADFGDGKAQFVAYAAR
jgi:hypothetical protein